GFLASSGLAGNLACATDLSNDPIGKLASAEPLRYGSPGAARSAGARFRRGATLRRAVLRGAGARGRRGALRCRRRIPVAAGGVRSVVLASAADVSRQGDPLSAVRAPYLGGGRTSRRSE